MARSAPTTPDNNLTTNVVTLPSATGFAAGDLIYYKDGDYKPIPGDALSSASFDVVQDVPTYQQPIGSNITNHVSQGTSRGGNIAVLSNGNVVTAYKKYSGNRPTFKITTTTGAVVVADTEISTVYTMSNNAAIGVAALSGGGFVVYWLNSVGGTLYVPTYAIYDNDGVVVTAVTQDAGAGQAHPSGYIAGVALPNGGFALSYIVDINSNTVTRAYGATGTPTFAWTTVGTTTSTDVQITNMAARNDSSYIIINQSTGSPSTFRLAVYSSAGVLLVSDTFTPTIASPSNNGVPISVSVLSDGVTFVIGYNVYDSSGSAASNLTPYFYYCFRFLSSSFVLSAETVLPPANVNIFANATNMPAGLGVKGLAAGGFVYTFTDNTGAINYAFFDDSGSAVSGTNAEGVVTYSIPGSYANYIYSNYTVVEYGGNVNLFWVSNGYAINGSMIHTSAISTTTYQLVNYQSVQDNIGEVTTTVNALGTVTPITASFLAANTSVEIVSNSMGFLYDPVTMTQTSCDAVAMAALADGGFVVVYRELSSPYSVTAVIHDKESTVLQTIAVGIGDLNSSYNTVSVAVLTGGSIIIAFHTANTILTLASYIKAGGSYVPSNKITVNGVVNANSVYRVGMSGITNDRFVIFYRESANGYAEFRVYSSSLALLSGPINVTTSNFLFHTVSAYTGGGFTLSGMISANAYYNYYYREQATNSFTQVASSSYGSTTQNTNFSAVNTPGNITLSTPGQATTTQTTLVAYDPVGGTVNSTQVITGLSNFNYGSCVGITGAGSVVFFSTGESGGTNGRAIAYHAGLQGSTSIPPSTSGPQTLNFSGLSVFTNTGSYGNIRTAPGPGYTCRFVWLDASRRPTLASLYAYPSTNSAVIIGGVTESAPQPITANSNLPLTGYVLQGVALTSAPAGGTGQVQTNGIARLNDNYSPTTPATAFDFQKPNGTGISGVKGTSIGNTVILEGKE